MTIIGFNFKKINIEKFKAVNGKININNNVSIVNVEEKELSLGKSKEKGLNFTFEFKTAYEPKIGSINLTGEILSIGDAKKVEEVLASWKKDKKLPKEVMANVLNTALNRCNIQALILSQQINLPPPIPLPKVEATKEEK